MALVGSIEHFTEGSSLPEYLERFEVYTLLNKITDEREKTIYLISVSGPLLYTKIKTASGEHDPLSVEYSLLKEALLKMMKPSEFEFVERVKFYSRHQQPGETAAGYVLALKELAKTCDFGDRVSELLRDRFVMGIANNELRWQIIESNPKSLDEASAVAQKYEMLNPRVNDLSSFGRSVPNRDAFNYQNPFSNGRDMTNFRSFPSSRGGAARFSQTPGVRMKGGYGACERCGWTKHKAACPAIDWTCDNCGRKGHIAKCCRNF